jgi:2'-5' RNA ligase
MPAPIAELARRNGVELVRTGRFQTLTGSWNPTPADIKAAVEAMDCPAIRKPVIRIGHTDRRFVGDGEPALGWFENLRAADGGHTLVADQVTLPWLHSVQAAAYPSRSIEGNYNHRCSEGHLHPFVIHTVALLGVTPPGVQTLRSLNDLPDMLGVAASGEVPEGAEHVQVTVMAAEAPDGSEADPVHTSATVALIPTADDAARLAVDGGEPADELHVTLAYLGDAADLGAQGQQDVIDAVSSAVNGLPIFDADIFSVNIFNPPSGSTPPDARDRSTCLVWGLSGDEIDAVHEMVSGALAGVGSTEQHRPWHAHITAAFSDDMSLIPTLAERVGPVAFDRVRLAFAGAVIDIPLIELPDAADLPDYSDDEFVQAAASIEGDDELKIFWLGKGAPDLPAAEPEHRQSQPRSEGGPRVHRSERIPLTARPRRHRRREAMLAALDELKTKADAPAEPTPEMVAAASPSSRRRRPRPRRTNSARRSRSSPRR